MKLWRAIGWGSAALGVLLLLVAGVVSWLLFTTSGARWVASTVTQRYVPQVTYARLDGTLAGALILHDFRFDGGAEAPRVRIARMTVDHSMSALLVRTLRINRAEVHGLVVLLPPPKHEPEKPDEPLWVEPPLDIVVRKFTLTDATIRQGREILVHVDHAGLAARWNPRELLIDRFSLRAEEFQGELRVTGRVTPEQDTVRGVLAAAWQDVIIPERLAGRVLHTRGQVDIDGTPELYAVIGNLDVGPPGEPTHVVLNVNGTATRAELKQLDLAQRAGKLALTGTVDFEPVVGWDLKARAREFNPGELLADWNGKVNLDASTRGQLAEAGPSGTLRIESLSGTLRGRPISGGGELEFAAPTRLAGDLQLSSGKSRISVKGSSADRQQIDASVELAIASLNDWVPDSQGSLTGKFRVRGVWPKLTIAGTADGKAVGMGDAQIAKLHLDASVETPLDPSGKLTATATELSAAGFVFTQVEVKASGNQARHRVALEADGEKLDASVEVAGGLTSTGWSGELTRLELDAPNISKLKLRDPARLIYDAGAFEIGQSCLADGEALLCVAADVKANGALKASYSFDRVPLALANALAPDAMPGQLRGEVAGKGEVRRAVDGQWFGDARVGSASAHLVMAEEGESAAALGRETLQLYENLDLHAELQGTKADASLTAALQQGGSLKASFTVTNLSAPAPTLRGEVLAAMPTLKPFAGFVPTVGNLDGAVDARIEISGTTALPEYTGTIDATKLQADLGELGIELRDGRVQGEAKRGGGFRLAGSVASGKGHVEFDGTMSERGVVNLRIDGQNFQAADIPAANVIMTPRLALTGDSKGYLLKGEVTIPSADINLQKLPQDSPPGVSPDVVVVRNGKEMENAAAAEGLPIQAVVTVKLGDRIKIVGYGLDATVTGQLVVREYPGVPTSGSGQVTVAGGYKAYGQDLTIREGRLLFAGTPLDNPRLSMTAMREINDDLETGLRITGSAKRPIITVISSPEVGEADALSYLVTGRSLSDVGSASGSSQDALASATRSLEGAAGGLIAKRIGARLGLDEAGVEENEMIGGSALTVGEYLSPRLYLSYGVGLFEPGEVIALRYRLTDDIRVRVQRGSEETRAGVEYRIEK